MLLILDLDETLIHATEQDLGILPACVVGKYNVYERPYLRDFLEFCGKNFEVAVWSSATEDYIDEILKQILPTSVKLSFVWGRNRCTPVAMARIDEWGHYDMDSSGYYEYTKKLHKLKRKGYRLEQILIVDDTPAKLTFNYGNGIYIKPFIGSPTDDILHKLMQYLPTLKDLPNVRTIEKRGWWNNF